MNTALGIDLGTSELKLALVDETEIGRAHV